MSLQNTTAFFQRAGRRSASRLLLLAACLLLLCTATLRATPGQAQAGERCFFEARYCISGRIRDFWERNGGLSVFGLPISPVETVINPATGRSTFVQWFERYRFELHPENQPPYDVLLGRLGSELLARQGIDTAPAEPQPGCLWFEESGHNVCDQAPDNGFATYWQTHGLNNPSLDSYGRSLALFGLPLTEAYMEPQSDGRQLLVQWFERARFEWHPLNPPPYSVLLSRLGAEFRADLPATTMVAGRWQGQTSQLQLFQFSVADNAIQTILFNVTIQGENCSRTFLYVESNFSAQGLTEFDGESFSATLEDDETFLIVSGRFESDNLATGTALIGTKPIWPFDCVGSAEVTWRTAREEDPPPVPPAPGGPPPGLPTTLPNLPDTSVESPAPTATSTPGTPGGG